MFSRQPMTYNGMRTALSLPKIVYTKITKSLSFFFFSSSFFFWGGGGGCEQAFWIDWID